MRKLLVQLKEEGHVVSYQFTTTAEHTKALDSRSQLGWQMNQLAYRLLCVGVMCSEVSSMTTTTITARLPDGIPTADSLSTHYALHVPDGILSCELSGRDGT